MVGGESQLCRDKSARTAGPCLAACQRIAATRADCSVVTALTNEGSGVLERAAVDANLEDTAIKALLKAVIVSENKSGVLKERDHHRRRSESLVADKRGIVN